MTARTRSPATPQGFVANPPWVTQALADAWETITAKVRPQWLPRLEDVHAKRGHVSADLAELGCGAYGCVLPTLDAGVVLKVTTDETEAEFAAYLSKDLIRPFVTVYRTVMSIPAKHEGRRIYLLWREEANDVGGIRAGSAADEAVYWQHKSAQAAYTLIADGDHGPDLVAAIGAWRDALKEMIKIYEIAYVARGMLEAYDQQGIFFGDIHAGNLGLVERDGQSTWVITDPGHVAVIEREDAPAKEHRPSRHQAGQPARTNPAQPWGLIQELLQSGDATNIPVIKDALLEHGDFVDALVELTLQDRSRGEKPTHPGDYVVEEMGMVRLFGDDQINWSVKSYQHDDVPGGMVYRAFVNVALNWAMRDQDSRETTLAAATSIFNSVRLYVVSRPGGHPEASVLKPIYPTFTSAGIARHAAIVAFWHVIVALMSEPTMGARMLIIRMFNESPADDDWPQWVAGLEEGFAKNPSKEGLGTWKAPQIFADTINARMLRLLWVKGSMLQSEFMQRYHRDHGDLEGGKRATRLTEGKTAFLNNLGRYVRGHQFLPSDAISKVDGEPEQYSARARLDLNNLAVKYLKPIERRNQDGIRRRRRSVRRLGGVSTSPPGREVITLFWVGPTVDEWLTSFTNDELDKAYGSMDQIATTTGREDDAAWLARIHAEIVKRGGGKADHRRIVKNPARDSLTELDEHVQRLLFDPEPSALEAIKDACLEHGEFSAVLAGVGERLYDTAHPDGREKLTQWLLANARFDLFVEQEQMDPRESFSNQQDIVFARTATDQHPWPWCSVTVTANYGDFEGDDVLGGCSYGSQADFMEPGGYFDDMKRSAVHDLISEMDSELADTLTKNVVAGRFMVEPMKNLGPGHGEVSVEWYLWPGGRDSQGHWSLVSGHWFRMMVFEAHGKRWSTSSRFVQSLDENRRYAAVAAFLAVQPLHHIDDQTPLPEVEEAMRLATRHINVTSLLVDSGELGRMFAKRRKTRKR